MKEIAQYRFCSETGFKEASQPEMTSIEILKTQEMARECMNSNYKNCGWRRSGGIKGKRFIDTAAYAA